MQAYCEIAKDMGVKIRKEEGRSLCVVAFRGAGESQLPAGYDINPAVFTLPTTSYA